MVYIVTYQVHQLYYPSPARRNLFSMLNIENKVATGHSALEKSEQIFGIWAKIPKSCILADNAAYYEAEWMEYSNFESFFSDFMLCCKCLP